MTIAEYQDLTGTTVSDADTPRVKAAIRKAETKLETLLGYSLSKQKKWTELGKVQQNGYVPFPSLPISDDVRNRLVAPDDEVGDNLLFKFDTLNMHLRINPAKEVYRAKVVLPVGRDEFITIYQLDNVTPYLNEAGLVVALTRYATWFTWDWWNSMLLSERMNLMLAVEGKFVNVCDADKYPDLSYLLADMVAYYSDSSYSVMGNIRSESIDSHSYSRAGIVAKTTTGSTYDDYAPEGQPSAKLVLAKYAGPGAYRNLVR